MKNTQVHRLVEGALIASLYIALTYAQELLLPGTTSMAVQFRLSEILCLLALFTPSAVWGLTIGTLVSNLLNVTALPLDILFGTLATFIAVKLVHTFKDIRLFSLPILSSLMPALINGIIIGLEIEVFLISGPFHFGSFLIQCTLVALGELGVCVVLGLPFVKVLERTKLFKSTLK